MTLADTPVPLPLCSYHWPNGIMYYTIDAAFSTSERAVIASGEVLLSAGNCARSVHLQACSTSRTTAASDSWRGLTR